MPIQAGNIEWCCTSLEVKNIAVTASEHLAITLVSQMSARAFLMLLNAIKFIRTDSNTIG